MGNVIVSFSLLSCWIVVQTLVCACRGAIVSAAPSLSFPLQEKPRIHLYYTDGLVAIVMSHCRSSTKLRIAEAARTTVNTIYMYTNTMIKYLLIQSQYKFRKAMKYAVCLSPITRTIKSYLRATLVKGNWQNDTHWKSNNTDMDTKWGYKYPWRTPLDLFGKLRHFNFRMQTPWDIYSEEVMPCKKIKNPLLQKTISAHNSDSNTQRLS